MKKVYDRITFSHALGVYVITLVFTYFFIYSFANLSKEQRESCREIAIAVIGIGSLILNFIYGSSYGSAKKDDLISAALTSASTPAVAVIADYDPIKTYKQGDKCTYDGKTWESTMDIREGNAPSMITADWKPL